MGGGPELSCGAKTLKVVLIIFNILFFLLGLGILAVGVYVMVDPSLKQIRNVANTDLVSLAGSNGINLTYIDKCGIAFIVFGSLMLAIAFMGCCGALRSIKCLLGLYSSVLLLLLLAEIGVGIFAGVFAGKLKEVLTPLLTQSIKAEYMGNMENKTLASVAWDAIMYNFECCGVNNSSDFNQTGNVWTNRGLGVVVPRSCCRFKNKTGSDWSGVIPNITSVNGYPECPTSPNAENSFFNLGCFERCKNLIDQSSVILIAVACGVGLILLLGVISGFYMCKKVGDLDDYV